MIVLGAQLVPALLALSFVILRDWRLHVLSGLTLLLLLTFWILDESTRGGRAMFGVASAYVIVSGVFGARWVALRRGRQA